MEHPDVKLKERMLGLRENYPKHLHATLALAGDLIGMASSFGMPSHSSRVLRSPIGSQAVNFYGLCTIGYLPNKDMEFMLEGLLEHCFRRDGAQDDHYDHYKYRSAAVDVISRRRLRGHSSDMLALLESIDQFDVIFDCDGGSKVTSYDYDRKRFAKFFRQMADG